MLPKEFALAALAGAPRTEAAVLEDYVQELSQLHDMPVSEVRPRFERFLDFYYRGVDNGTEDEWTALSTSDLAHSFIRISKPYRFRHYGVVPEVRRVAKRELRSGSVRPTLLEYGGGGGSDAIIYARSGFDVSYADLVSLRNTETVGQRFALRGLDIPIFDASALPRVRFDVFTAIDVLEHIYDVEETIAQLASRLRQGGLLCCVNAFHTITYNGDHHDKNRVYVSIFGRLMASVGCERVSANPPLEVYRRTGEVSDNLADEMTSMRSRLYRTTRDTARAHSKRLLNAVSGTGDVQWQALPVGDVAEGNAQAEASSASRQTLSSRAYTFAARHAPAAAKRRVYNRRLREEADDLTNITDPARTLAAVADWIAVLRIAEHRLRSLPPV